MKKQLIYHSHVTTSQSNKISVKVQTDSEVASCSLDRVSRDGLSLCCNAETLHNIMPNKTTIAPKDPVSLTATFTLDKIVKANCRVVFARRLSKDKFVIELKFVDIDEQAMQNLDSYIDRTLKSGLQQTEATKPGLDQKNDIKDLCKIDEDLRMPYSKVA